MRQFINIKGSTNQLKYPPGTLSYAWLSLKVYLNVIESWALYGLRTAEGAANADPLAWDWGGALDANLAWDFDFLVRYGYPSVRGGYPRRLAEGVHAQARIRRSPMYNTDCDVIEVQMSKVRGRIVELD